MWYVWLIAAGVFFIAEIITVGFLIFWLGIGALLAMTVSFFTDNLVIQTGVFVVSSIILIFLTKPLTKKITKGKTVQTNAYSAIGKEGIVVSEINFENPGQVKVEGEIWAAKSIDNQLIEKGNKVRIVKIDGVKLIVEKN